MLRWSSLRPLRLVLCALLVGACSETAGPAVIHDVRPLGTLPVSEAALARFVRRAHLDLAGKAPSDAEVDAQVARLTAAEDVALERQRLVEELLDGRPYAARFVAELEARAFAGQGRKSRETLSCIEAAAGQAACAGCSGDPCACGCASVGEAVVKNEALHDAESRYQSSDSSAAIERLYAESPAVYAGVFGDPSQRATRLFEVFLGRPPAQEELENAAAMMLGPVIDDPAAGLTQVASGVLFGRAGRDEADLLDIVFTSEVYRESTVRAVFARYLGREPQARELLHFTSALRPEAPDTRAVVAAVVSSEEYFEQ